MVAEPGGDDGSPCLAEEVLQLSESLRERSIALRVADLVRMLGSDPALDDAERESWNGLCKRVIATFHHEFLDQFIRLKERYAPLDPDGECRRLDGISPTRTDDSDERFLKTFEDVLVRANYRPMDLEVLTQAIRAPNELGLTYVPNLNLFEHLRVYVRGDTTVTRKVRTWNTRFRKRPVELSAYSRLIVAIKFQPGKHLGDFARSDVLYLRLFKDVPHVDMEMHLPEQGTKVRMRLVDKAQIASPMMTGLPVLAAKIFLGLASPFAIGVLIAPFSAGVNSFFGFQRARQKHLHRMIRHLYYLTMANNSSVIHRLIDSAEEEDTKEALLAYFVLWRSDDGGRPWTRNSLNHAVRALLADRAGLIVDFEIGDALHKLLRLGLVRHDESHQLHAVPIAEAMARLDRRWNRCFKGQNSVRSHDV
jgi:hypothetical protein